MLGFVGQFQHTLDVKGRLILPSKFRPEFERGGHLSPATEGCVALWTPGEFSRQNEEWLQLSRLGGASARQQMRYWASNSWSVDFDKQGRFALPTSIRDYGQLSGDVLVVGASQCGQKEHGNDGKTSEPHMTSDSSIIVS